MREAQCTNCEANSCNVLIGKNTYCSKCSNTNTEAPINGVCKAISNDPSGCKLKGSADGTCESCGAGYFLHKGGCYAQATPPGQIICQTAGSDGTCTTCSGANGYFKNPEAAATTDSCISCGDASGVTIPGNHGNTYKGVANCATCQPPEAATPSSSQQKVATCTACVDGYYDAPACTKKCDSPCIACSGAAATCTKCGGDTAYLKKDPGTCLSADACRQAGAFFPSETLEDSTKVCKACHGDCAACTGALETDCTKCKAGNSKDYLKVLDAEDGSGQCVAPSGCTGTHFPVTDDKKCYLCNTANKGGVTDCKTCSKDSGALKCLTCTTDTKKPNKEGTRCFDCDISGCAYCSEAGKCEECGSGFKLEGEACVPAGTNLSTGALAGISVAAVVVVGGLVGFLCWWFICRGKA